MGVETFKDDYIEMALLRQWGDEAEAAIQSQQSEHQRPSCNIVMTSIYK